MFILVVIILAIPTNALAKFGQFELSDCKQRIGRIESLPDAVVRNACESLSAQKVTFNIMTVDRGPSCKNLILMNGEDHAAHPSIRKPMYDLGTPFAVRLIEDAWDLDKVKGSETLHEVIKSYNQGEDTLEEAYGKWKKSVERWGELISSLRKFPLGSPMEDIWDEPGIRLDVTGDGKFSGNYKYPPSNSTTSDLVKLLDNVETLSHTGTETCSKYRTYDVKKQNLSPIEYLRIYKEFIGKPGFPPISISSEFGKLDHYKYDCSKFDSFECGLYLLTARNRRFALNIKKVIDELPCGVPISLTVGAAHIEGISRNLETLGFAEVDSELSGYSYFNFPTAVDSEHPGNPDRN